MQRISAYIISLVIISWSQPLAAQDSIKTDLKIRAGFDLIGPASYLTDHNSLNIEGFFAIERTPEKTLVLEAGYQNFRYSQYNYSYISKGAFMLAGIDFNLIQPFLAAGKYYGGVGLRYGLSVYSFEVPSFNQENYWGTGTGSVPSSIHAAHFIEVTPGIKADIFRNISIGWNLRLRLMIYRGTGKDLKPVSVPGYGNGVKGFSPGINYYIVFNIPYKSVWVKPEVEKVTEPEPETVKK